MFKPSVYPKFRFRLESAGFPTKFLPRVEPADTIVGVTSQKHMTSLPAGIPVFIALGDFQCSFLARQTLDSDAGRTFMNY